ncbi:MAG: methyltransferase domain-containing protein [Ferruginibacter sp.]|nr:methyltransferase domain-containing protein [Cytophagales bacterium]
MKPSRRRSFQGVYNVLLFNRHYYWASLAGLVAGALLLNGLILPEGFRGVAWLGLAAVAYFTVASLAASWWVYDASPLYRWEWLPGFVGRAPSSALNIHAGFDETSGVLRELFPDARWETADFYDPTLHTEISLARARRQYPAPVFSQPVLSSHLPYPIGSFEAVFVLFAAHEIRKPVERVQFFEELKRVLRPGGSVILVEHLRDGPNFLAFGTGFTHFYSRSEWERVIESAGLRVEKQLGHTPFVKAFKIGV